MSTFTYQVHTLDQGNDIPSYRATVDSDKPMFSEVYQDIVNKAKLKPAVYQVIQDPYNSVRVFTLNENGTITKGLGQSVSASVPNVVCWPPKS